MVNYLKAILSVLVSSCVLSGCGTTTIVGHDGPCPERPQLMALPADLQIQMPPDAVWIVAENQLALKQHVVDLESLLNCQE